MGRLISASLLLAGLGLVLSGCVLLPFIPHQQPQQTPTSPDGPLEQGPAGWTDLEPCDPSDRWVWVDGYPADEMEAAGLEAECGGTYFDPDVPTYTSSGDSSVTDDQLQALLAELEASGYEQTASSFVHPEAGDDPGLVGSFQYERNAGDPAASETIFVVNFWSGGQPVEYETFVDYESPATRALTL